MHIFSIACNFESRRSRNKGTASAEMLSDIQDQTVTSPAWALEHVNRWDINSAKESFTNSVENIKKTEEKILIVIT
jgi:hypothetical protein